jgi:hypothetical protein
LARSLRRALAAASGALRIRKFPSHAGADDPNCIAFLGVHHQEQAPGQRVANQNDSPSHLHGDVVVPDLSRWRRSPMPEIPDVAFFELSPDWVCEVASPSTEAVDRSEKMPLYARERV